MLKIKGTPEVKTVLLKPDKDGVLVLTADDAYLHNNEGGKEARLQHRDTTPNNIGYWIDETAWVEWSFQIDQPGEYRVTAELAVQEAKSRFRLEGGEPRQPVEVSSTGGYGNYVELPVATVTLGTAGECSLRIRPEKGAWQPLNLRQVRLTRQ